MTRRCLAAALCGLLALSAACGSGEQPEPPLGPVSVGEGVGASTTAARGEPPAPGDTGGADDAPSSPGAPRPTSPPGRPGSGSRTTLAEQPAAADKGPVGSFARTLLQAHTGKRIVVDVIVQEGASYRASHLEHSLATLREVSGKSVSAEGPIMFAESDDVHSSAEIRAFADKHARTPQGSGVAALRVLVLRGEFEADRNVLGVAVRGEVIALFPTQTERAATVAASWRRIDEAVYTHELGHILGLVDIVIDRGRDDPSHPGHSSNPESVMYWAIDTNLITQVLSGPPPRDFDAADLADLAALRSGA